MPYDNYFLTQGVHGQSYGHLAIDIAAGNSPFAILTFDTRHGRHDDFLLC